MTDTERGMISLPLAPWVHEIVESTAKRVIAEHVATCPLASRMTQLEVKFSALVGFMVGSGILGGVGGGLLVKAMGG
jgi:hypothetical protein